MTKRTLGAIAAAAGFLGAIVAANYAITRYGRVDVSLGLGLMAPAGVYFAGLTFVLRDAVQDRLGRLATVGLIVLGAALSAVLSPKVALASGTAFVLSELLDLAVYSRLRRRGYLKAAVASNLAGAVLDSLVFLTLVGYSLADNLVGQVVGKTWVTGVVLVLVLAGRLAVAMRQRGEAVTE